VVDDEIEILNLVCDELIRQGHEVVSARSPMNAIELLKVSDNNIKLVICDVIMPQKNGLDFVRELKQITAFEGTVAIMSSYTTMLRQEIEEAGIKYVMTGRL
jgi:two-component system chemotaxis response regulator CheY